MILKIHNQNIGEPKHMGWGDCAHVWGSWHVWSVCFCCRLSFSLFCFHSVHATLLMEMLILDFVCNSINNKLKNSPCSCEVASPPRTLDQLKGEGGQEAEKRSGEPASRQHRNKVRKAEQAVHKPRVLADSKTTLYTGGVQYYRTWRHVGPDKATDAAVVIILNLAPNLLSGSFGQSQKFSEVRSKYCSGFWLICSSLCMTKHFLLFTQLQHCLTHLTQGMLPLNSSQPAGLNITVDLHVFLRVVNHLAEGKLFVRGFVFMADASSFDFTSGDSQLRSSPALMAWPGDISIM